MSLEIKVPVLPESVADAMIATWHKRPGEKVSRDENLVDIETDKVVLEVVAPSDGVISSIIKREGDTVTADEVIAVFQTDSGKVAISAKPVDQQLHTTLQQAQNQPQAEKIKTTSNQAKEQSMNKSQIAMQAQQLQTIEKEKTQNLVKNSAQQQTQGKSVTQQQAQNQARTQGQAQPIKQTTQAQTRAATQMPAQAKAITQPVQTQQKTTQIAQITSQAQGKATVQQLAQTKNQAQTKAATATATATAKPQAPVMGITAQQVQNKSVAQQQVQNQLRIQEQAQQAKHPVQTGVATKQQTQAKVTAQQQTKASATSVQTKLATQVPQQNSNQSKAINATSANKAQKTTPTIAGVQQVQAAVAAGNRAVTTPATTGHGINTQPNTNIKQGANTQPKTSTQQGANAQPGLAIRQAAVTDDRRFASPAIRRVLAERNIDPAKIVGTGVGGRITKEDVIAYINKQQQNRKLASPRNKAAADQGANQSINTNNQPRTQMASTSAVKATDGMRDEKRVPMTRLRARIAERLLQAQNNAAILTTFNEVNMQPIVDLRNKYKDKFEQSHGVKLGFMSFFVIAAIEALKQFPAVNASIDGNDIVYHGYYDIGIAVSSSRGLVVPVLRDANTMSFAAIEKGIIDFSEKAQSGKLTIEDITGGTFTISNGGVFGSLMSTPILNPPQSGILGMHKIEQRPVVEDGQIVIRPMMYLALSYDHRIIDGAESVRFLLTIKNMLEDPARLLLHI